MMDGPRNAKNLVKEYLAGDLPTRLIGYRNWWNLDDIRLPNPDKYIAHEPIVLDHWPTIITLVDSTLSMVRDNYDDYSDPVYEVTYAMRTYIWARSEGLQRVTDIRDDLTTVIRDALLDHPSLREVPRYEHCYPNVVEESMREEFSDITHVKGERFLCGAYLAYNLRVRETITRELASEASVLAYTINVEQMSKVPNAPTQVLAVPGDTQAVLTWRASTWDGGGETSIAGYTIEQSTDGGSTWASAVADTGTTIPTYTVTSLTNGETYQFRVAAFNGTGTGEFSDSSNAVVPTV